MNTAKEAGRGQQRRPYDRRWLTVAWMAQLAIGLLIALPVWFEVPALAPLMIIGWLAGFWVVSRESRRVADETLKYASEQEVSTRIERQEDAPLRVAATVFQRTQHRPDLTIDDVAYQEVIEVLTFPDVDQGDDAETDNELAAMSMLSELPPNYAWDKILDNEAARAQVRRFAITVWSDRESRQRLELAATQNPLLAELVTEVTETMVIEPPPDAGERREKKATSKDLDMTIIVHGTWAKSKNWWQPGGDFWSYIDEKEANNQYPSEPFSWSGANRHSSRVQAADELLIWAESNPHDSLDVIAHSHGGNVCFLATQKGLKICHLILLGTPIRLEYIPNLRNVNMIHNVFSTWDNVQAPIGTKPNPRGEGRTLADTDKIVNHRIEDPGPDPLHSALHSSEIWERHDLFRLVHSPSVS